MDEALLFGFLMVFLRCSAMMFSSPVFGSQTTPVHIRVLTTLAFSAALVTAIHPARQGMPSDLYGLAAMAAHEIVAGLLIGTFFSFALQAAHIAGALLDLQVGLSTSQVLNPITGVSVTVLSQFKGLLGTVIFLGINGHHLILDAFVRSYRTMPTFSPAVVQQSLVGLVGSVFVIAVQIAAPVVGVTVVVDAALGIVNRAVPQMQALNVGMPAKIGVGLVAVSLSLPALVGGVNAAVGQALVAVGRVFGF